MSKKFSLLVFSFLFHVLSAQIPNTDVWLFKLEKTKTEFKLAMPSNITNRVGYDNQPSFSNDSKKIYYVSIKEDAQADMYCYDIKTKKTNRTTATKESEYSPLITNDNKFLTSVVVEVDSTQRIHYVNSITGISEKKVNVDSVGYYTFLNSDTVLYYKLTNPHSLHYFVKSINEDGWLGNNPTRAFAAINRHTFIYGIKDSAKVVFYTYDFVLKKAEKYCEYPSLNEDFVWHSQFGLVKSEGDKLLNYNQAKKGWAVLFDLSSFGIKKVTRFNFDQKNRYLVLVNNL